MKAAFLTGLAFLALAGCADEAGLGNAPAAVEPRGAEPGAGAAFKRVVVFGDSLVDAGNVHIATGGRRASPEQGFVEGRFTNGYSFADRIAMGVEGRVTTPSRAGGNNFAYGGAKALPDEDGIPDAPAQVEEWRSALRRPPEPDTLFILTFGGNDLRRPRTVSGGIEAYHRTVARSYADSVRTLFANGARNVLVTGAPLLNEAGASLQRRLEAELDAIELKPGQRLLRYDFLPFWTSLLADAPKRGFLPWSRQAAATASMPRAPRTAGDDCVGDRRQSGGCEGYILFDRVHPTAAVHALIASDIAARLSVPVAEPSR